MSRENRKKICKDIMFAALTHTIAGEREDEINWKQKKTRSIQRRPRVWFTVRRAHEEWIIHTKIDRFLQFEKKTTDGRRDRRTDGGTDGRTDPHRDA